MTRDDSECPTCGAVSDEFVTIRSYYQCCECGSQLDNVTAVPIEELEALADEWESTDNVLEANEPEQYGKYDCAQELRELVAEYE